MELKQDGLSVTFLGTGSVLPEAGRETASLLVAERVMVDAGWCGALGMLSSGVSPAELECLCLTHCHQDHYLGLPHLLFYRRMFELNYGRSLPPLRIVGPAGEVERVVELAAQFLKTERPGADYTPPEVDALRAGDEFSVGNLRVTTCGTIHAVPGLSYRFQSADSVASVAVSGDTAFNPPVSELAKGASLLVHEAAAADREPDPASGAGHSGGAQAGRIAAAAGVNLLALTHGYLRDFDATLAAAKRFFPQTVFPRDGETYLIDDAGQVQAHRTS